MIRVAHLADLHLGSRRPDDDFSYQALERVEEAIVEDHNDLVIIAGDVIDRHACRNRASAAFLRFVERIDARSVPTVVIGGNHDAESGTLAELRLPASVSLLPAARPSSVVFDALGVAVHGQSVAHRDEIRRLAAGYPRAVQGLINIGVLHTSWTGGMSSRICAPVNDGDLLSQGYDYWALGHVHEFQSVSDLPQATYAGSTHPRAWHDNVDYGFADVQVERGSASVTHRVTIPAGSAPIEWPRRGSE